MRFLRLGLTAAALTACASFTPLAHAQSSAPVTVHLKTADGTDAGTAQFRQMKNGELSIKLDLKNLPPGEHGVHIHEKPVCDAPDFKGAGGHFDPDGKQHGYDNPMGPHNGDLPHSVMVLPNGTAHASFMVTNLSLGTGKPNDIIGNGTQLSNGTAIMVHAGADDEKTDPSGNSGSRIACGVIQGREVAKSGGN